MWLTPFDTSPQADGGYDVSDHRAVDPRLGVPVFSRPGPARPRSGLVWPGPVCLLNTRDETVCTTAPGELLLCSVPEESRDAMEAGAPADQLRIPANSRIWWAA